MTLVDYLVLAADGPTIHMVPARAETSERALALTHRAHERLTPVGAIRRSQLERVLQDNVGEFVVIALDGLALHLVAVHTESSERAMTLVQQAHPQLVPVGAISRDQLHGILRGMDALGR